MGAVTGVANELGGKLMDDSFKIIELPKENWKGVTIPLVTRSDSFYDLIMEPLDDSGCKISLVRKKSEKEIVHTPEEYDFPDRAMMGEFIIKYRGKIIGGIYDDRLLVKPVKSAIRYMPMALYELPYEGAKEMLLVDEVDNKEFLTGLFHAMYDELPDPKTKKKK